MDVISNSAARYARLREEEMSLDEYLTLCQRDPMVYASAAQRMPKSGFHCSLVLPPVTVVVISSPSSSSKVIVPAFASTFFIGT